MKSIVIPGLFFALSITIVKAQTPAYDPNAIITQFKNVVPPTPDAAALGKFGDIPVGYSTGIPSIAIPVYSWTSNRKDISLSISLNYHAGGYRVEEMASDVGLGWALSAGGSVSRTMRGLPDDYPALGFLNSPSLPAVSNYDYPGGYFYADQFSQNTEASDVVISLQNSPGNYDSIRSLQANQLDAQQDIYNYSLSGKSGRFVINKQGIAQKLDDNKVIITPVTQAYSQGGYALTGFIIIDERGIKYTFSAGDVNGVTTQTTTSSLGQSNNAFPTVLPGYTATWNLQEISSPFGEEKIEFQYEQANSLYNIIYENGFSETSTICDGLYLTPGMQNFELSHSWSYSSNEINKTRIKEIKMPDSTVIDFTYNFARLDLANDHALTKINIRNGPVTKGDTLTYGYFTTIGGGLAFQSASTNDYTKKLQLTSVTEYGGNLIKPPYSITYNSTPIPQVSSADVDYWGYYTGPYRYGYTLIPALTVAASFSPTVLSLLANGNDRSPDSAYAQAGLIQKLTYPTGGYTSFQFETNDCSSSIVYYHKIATDSLQITNAQSNIIMPLNLQNRTSQAVNFTIDLIPGGTGTGITGWQGDCPISFVVVSSDGTFSQTLTSGVYANYANVSFGVSINLALGTTYIIKMIYSATGSCAGAPNFTVNVTYQYDLAINGQLTGGVRIKNLTDFDPVTGRTVIRQFQYINPDGTSSGVINVVPNFDYYQTTQVHPQATDCPSGGTCDLSLVNRVSNSNVLLGSFGGGNVIYTRVVEKRVNAANVSLGSSIYQFTPFDGIGFLSSYPYPPGQQYDWKMGLPTMESYYDSTNTLLKSVTNYYQYFLNELYNPANRSFRVGEASTYTSGTSNNLYIADDFYPYVGRAQKIAAVTKEYANGNVLSDSILYTYDPTYYVLKQTNFTDSKGIPKKLLNYYPQDYTGISPLTNMASLNMISVPVSSEEWQTYGGVNQLTRSGITDYEAFPNAAFRLNKYYLFRPTSPVAESTIGDFNPAVLVRNTTLFQNELTVSNYDLRGNANSLVEHDGLNQVLLWDYYAQQLICRVSNANLSDVAYTSFEADGSGNWTIPDTTRNRISYITGNISYNLNSGNTISKAGLNSATTYIVGYWSTNGSLNVNGTSGTAKATVGTWTYYEHQLTGSTSVSVAGTSTIDELRLFPKGSLMTTYTYTPLLGMTSQCSPTNYITYYSYDGLGRLKVIKDLRGNIVKTFDYNYQGQ